MNVALDSNVTGPTDVSGAIEEVVDAIEINSVAAEDAKVQNANECGNHDS